MVQKQTNKGVRYIQMRENVVRENPYANITKVLHIWGKINPSNMFTKEKREKAHDYHGL